MRFPYGNSDFQKIILENYLYIDRTDRIPLIEEAGDSLLFLRPRRFGKSLLVSMLENYYDIAKADDFERLFGHLAIGKNPTPLHNQYMVMKWDFSFVRTYGSVDDIDKALHQYINQRLRDLMMRYAHLLTGTPPQQSENAMVSLLDLLTVVRQSGHKLYLLIDEYDNFANEVLMSGTSTNPERYETLVTGEGIFKSFFKAVKGGMAGLGLDRSFITGVSPIVMSDVTSGYNIAENISWLPELSDLCGFREPELQVLVEQVLGACQLPRQQVADWMELLRTFYNGSCFSFNNELLVYNPTLVFYFLKHFQRRCEPPEKMLDGNLSTDYQKLVYISEHPDGEEILLLAMNGDEDLSVTDVGERFGVKELLASDKRRDRMASLLCYLGVLTVAGRTADGGYTLAIPNLAMQRLYAERVLELMLPPHSQQAGQDAARILYSQGKMQPLCDFFEQNQLKIFDNRDYHGANELTIKTLFLTLLYNDIAYIMDSEPALERTYADLVMILRPAMRRFSLFDILIEFKYLSLAALKLSGQEVKEQTAAGLKQLPPVQAELAQAKTQLRHYADKLHVKYGDSLRLRTFAVVALGFERLVWEEVD